MKARALVIEDHSCLACGYRWTHSYSILTDEAFRFWGGTPIGRETNLPHVILAPRSAAPANGCFRCVVAPVNIPSSSLKADLSKVDDLTDL